MPKSNLNAKSVITDAWLAKTKKEVLVLKSPKGLKQIYVVPGVKGYLLGTVNGHKVYAVDADAVCSKFKQPDFVDGGNSKKWEFIPTQHYWVNGQLNLTSIRHIVLHEACEETLMSKLGFSYDKAHRYSNIVEMTFLLELRPELKKFKKQAEVMIQRLSCNSLIGMLIYQFA